jgi:outer membrane protein assembly factor BamB
MLRLHAICIDRRSGKLIHDIEILRKKDPQWAHKLNSYASPTPVIENGKLFCHFGAYGTACVDTRSAEVVWRNQELYVHHENGPGSTPVIWKDKLIFHMDGSDDQYIVALNTSDGRVAWKTQRTGKMPEHPQLKKCYGTPLILQTDRGPTLFSTAADWLYGYNPDNGEELWKMEYGFTGFSIVPRPVAGHGLLYLSTSFMRPQLLAIQYNEPKPEIAWSYKRSVPAQPSPLLVGNELYIVSDSGGMVSCLDAKSGETHWQERIGGNYSASPLHANGKIYFHSREGVTTVLNAGTTFEILSKNKLDGDLMASAAVDGNALILRTDKAIYRIEE